MASVVSFFYFIELQKLKHNIMYNPLIELKHTDGSNTFIRASDIIRIEKWEENKIFYKNGNLESYYKSVKNISEIVELLNEVENRNELSMFMRT